MSAELSPSLSQPEPHPLANRDFYWVDSHEPHAARRRALLAQYPQIRALFGPCPRTKYVCTLLVAAQLLAAYLVRDASLLVVFATAYLFGGVANQALFLAIHELSHNLAFKKAAFNRWFALFVNLPAGIPVAATFRHYHLLHHAQQGHAELDTDLPSDWERRHIVGPLRKSIWLLFQGLAYGLRPLLVHPKKPDAWEITNLLVQLAFNTAVFYFWGWKALLYLPLGSLLGMGLHPIAGHFISEHYVFKPGQETYSYYGPLNQLTFNVGFHNEHHDFPFIPGSRLPQLKKLAPEFYDTLLAHRSWSAVLWQYVWRPDIGITSRVKRRSVSQQSSS
jgi:sphingolipid 4-desaturase/C4-monooxygenase